MRPTETGQPEGPAVDTDALEFRALDLAEGTRIKQFELIRELGRGGMGQVFRARDTKLGRLVAIKFLALSSAELVERFLVEAKATARCQHENIVVIHEVDEWNGTPYMVLEYLEGTSLGDLLQGGTLTPRRAVELMIPVIRALDRAHEFNIVHRDLKPDNIFVTSSGVVKVLDFGIAKLFEDTEPSEPSSTGNSGHGIETTARTQAGRIVGTMPYMSPEQWGLGAVDYSTDLWAAGIIFWEMLTGRHPVEPLTMDNLVAVVGDPYQRMRNIGQVLPSLPAELERTIDRCLGKDTSKRFPSAAALLEALAPLAPAAHGRAIQVGANPYPGLVAFQESDASRFFGRDNDIANAAQRIEQQPLLAIVGPSGAGKSSFVRAGLVPQLKASGQDWECIISRPGSAPIDALASLLHGMVSTSSQLDVAAEEHARLASKLRSEPGYLGTFLRNRARQKNARILLFVDQFEELYTLVADPAERLAYTGCLSGVADDPLSPLRVVISMRSDFLDRAAEDRVFIDRMTRGLAFLPPITREGMREALVHPLDLLGYRFESSSIVDRMLSELTQTPGALPLLQFTAAKLWEVRDESRKLLTTESYDALGGVAGALATHADSVIQTMPSAEQKLARAVFQRLVTTDGTRAVVEIADIEGLGDKSVVDSLVNRLVAARLLTTRERGDVDGPAVEIVHESLIQRWPTLRRWLDERGEDSAFLEQLRHAAKQWDNRGRAGGLLWRGEAMEDARRFAKRYRGELAGVERQYLDAVLELATRSARRKRAMVIGAFAFLLVIVAGALVALMSVRSAEQTARQEREEAQKQAAVAERETERAQQAEKRVKKQLEEIETAQAARRDAQSAAAAAEEKARSGQEKLDMTYEQLETALARSENNRLAAEAQRKKAEEAMKTAQQARKEAMQAKRKTEGLLAKERERVRKLQERAGKLIKGSDLE